MPAHTLFSSIEQYRDEVRLHTECPACGAPPTMLCRKITIEHDQREIPSEWIRVDLGNEVDYIHDDRCLVHANEMLVCP